MYQQILISEKSISRCGYLNFILTVFVCANIWAQIIGKSSLFVTFRRLWISQASRALILLIVVLREKSSKYVIKELYKQ
jgi:hypothetical protein